MESFKYLVNSALPSYMSSLPVPGSFGQLLSLSAKEWLQLVPVFATVGLVGFISYKEVNDFLKRNQHAWVNKDYKKSNSKIVDMITRPEFNAALEKNEKVAYCRCWKSKKFPFCDGAHGKHNTQTGDNVGPLVFQR